jgi:hypothetical protein
LVTTCGMVELARLNSSRSPDDCAPAAAAAGLRVAGDVAYDLIASVTGQPVDWIIPGGSAGTANNDEGGIGSAAEPFGGRGDQQVRQGSPEVRGRRNATPRAPSRGVGPTECTGVVRQPRNQA